MLVFQPLSLAAFIIVVAESFLLGSIPWGVVISKLFLHDDVREHGSGNIGTTNMMRTYGKKMGVACFVLDFLKGIVACAIALLLTGVFAGAGWIDSAFAQSRTLLAFSGFACIYGHIFSPWLHFKGGKGIACGVAVVLMIYGPAYAALELAVFIVLVAITKYVSVGSIAAAVLFCFLAVYCFGETPVNAVFLILAGATVVWAHRANIARLRAGKENKIGSKKKA